MNSALLGFRYGFLLGLAACVGTEGKVAPPSDRHVGGVVPISEVTDHEFLGIGPFWSSGSHPNEAPTAVLVRMDCEAHAVCVGVFSERGALEPLVHVERDVDASSLGDLLPIGDLDGDGVGDLLMRLDGMRPCISRVVAVSSRDSRIIHWNECSRGPSAVKVLGDLDGDTVEDYVTFEEGALVAWAGRGGGALWRYAGAAAEGACSGGCVRSLIKLPDINADGASEVGLALFSEHGEARVRFVAIDGRLGTRLWQRELAVAERPLHMGATIIPDMNSDTYPDVAWAIGDGGVALISSVDGFELGGLDAPVGAVGFGWALALLKGYLPGGADALLVSAPNQNERNAPSFLYLYSLDAGNLLISIQGSVESGPMGFYNSVGDYLVPVGDRDGDGLVDVVVSDDQYYMMRSRSYDKLRVLSSAAITSMIRGRQVDVR